MASEAGRGADPDRQEDERMSEAGDGEQQPTAAELAVQLAASEEARKAAEAEASRLRTAGAPAPKGVVNSPKPFTGKKGQPWPEWLAKWVLWAGAVGLLAHQMGPVLLTYIEGPAMQHLTLTLAGALAVASVDQINEVLSAASLGSNPTDHSVRKKLFGLRLKRLATGRFDFETFFADLKRLMLQAPHAVDEQTIIYVITQALPDNIAQHVATDTTTGKPWLSADAFMRHILTCADTLYRLLPVVATPADNSRDRKRPRVQASTAAASEHRNGNSNGNGNKHVHQNKPSYVPGRTPAEINELRKASACFKCGKPGHKAIDCKSGAK